MEKEELVPPEYNTSKANLIRKEDDLFEAKMRFRRRAKVQIEAELDDFLEELKEIHGSRETITKFAAHLIEQFGDKPPPKEEVQDEENEDPWWIVKHWDSKKENTLYSNLQAATPKHAEIHFHRLLPELEIISISRKQLESKE